VNEKEKEKTDFRESLKLRFELFKHLTTLSTGSLLLMLVLLEKLFKTPEWKGLIVVAFISFLYSIICSLISMNLIARQLKFGESSDAHNERQAGMDSLSFIAFIIGLASIGVFVVKNIF